MIYEPYLMAMGEMIEGLRWQSGLSGSYENSPDSGVTEALLLVQEQRKTPTAQKSILAMLLQHSHSDFFSDFAVCAMRSRGSVLVCVVSLVAELPVIES
jgi:hypothetical protein